MIPEKDSSGINIGWIPYWNLEPLRIELLNSWGSSIHFNKGTPTVVNKLLADSEVMVAPSSSVCLLKNQEMALPLGVSATNSTHSIYIGLNRDTASLNDLIRKRINSLKEICHHANLEMVSSFKRTASFIMDTADELPAPPMEYAPSLRLLSYSASGVALAKIFYRLVFGKHAYESMVTQNNGNGDASLQNSSRPVVELMIGDEALIKRNEFIKIIDLGNFWSSLTGLPFVSAVWQKGAKPISLNWRKRFLDSAELAQAKMKIEPTAYYPSTIPMDSAGNQIDLSTYWKALHYRLNQKDFKGLLLFLSLARPLLKSEIDESAIAKMLRWQDSLGISMPLLS